MNSFFAQVVIVAALVAVAVVFPMVVYSTTCQTTNPCTSNVNSPCVTAGKGTNNERCSGVCNGPVGCTCTRPDGNPAGNCICRKINVQ